MRRLRSIRRLCLVILVASLGACASSSEGLAPEADGATARVDSGVGVGDGPIAPTIDAPIGSHGGDGGAGLIFDPCVANPQGGYDPVAAGLAACCTSGPAHCVPASEVIPKLVDYLSACPGGTSVCMPDPIVRAGGQYVPASCTSSVTASAGACLSKCIPLVAQNPLAVALQRDSCGVGELCIPCTNPLDQTPTGACSLIETLCPAQTPDAGTAPDAGSTCPHTGPPVIDPSTLAACSPTCGGAHCLPAALVPTAQQALLSACTATGNLPGLCAPDELIEAGGNLVPTSCTSVAGAEGRCLSTCLPDIAEKSALLPRDVCAEDQRCAPCYDPTSSSPTTATGACDLSCDHPARPPVVLACPWTGPPVIDATTLPECSPTCGGAHCVPGALVPAALHSLLATCTGGFCAPDPFIESAGQVRAKACRSVAGAEGRCLSTCLPPIAAQAALLPTDVCSDGEVCAPCFDPTSSEPTAPTGACTIGCDAAAEPPVVLTCPWSGPEVVDPDRFPGCAPACGGAHCVPGSLVPSLLQPLLATCSGGFCAPDDFIATAGNFRPKTCASIAGAEGRCLSTCLPDVADKIGLLPRDVCQSDERCVPCFDPTSSDPTTETGACSTTCDQPRQTPVILTCPWNGPPVIDPAKFPACGACGGMHCVPADMIPEDQRGLLAACTGGFCAPDPIIATDNHWVPKSCTSVAGAEGRCLSACLPPIAAQAALLPQGSCSDGERCAPCFDPTSADPTKATGACGIACDVPKDPPVTLTCPWDGPAVIDPNLLPSCAPACGGSHCLPAAFVPADQQALLAPCPGGFCTPDPIIQSDNNFVPATCASVAGVEGRCLSTCLPSVAGQPLLPRSTCGPSERCVPCYDPTSANWQDPTGACALGCDQPAHPPTQITCPWQGPAVIDPNVLPQCSPACGLAHCLPAAYVPADQQALLATCPGGFCAPDEIIRTGGEFKPFSCNAFSGTAIPGRCLSFCLPSVAAQLGTLEQTSCNDFQRCVPCADPFTGADTGACEISCDMAPSPPVTFARCCFDGARSSATCVPRSQIPDDQEGNLQLDSCPSDAYRCVPNELLPGGSGGQGCEGPFYLFFYDGTCESNCLDLGLGEIFPQQSCPGNHSCIPCTFAPDGSPGC